MEQKKIDKNYWLNFGYELIDGGIETLHKQIKSINTYVNGLLAFYGAISILGSIYSEVNDFWHYFLIILPILIVKSVDWYSNVFSKPDPIDFFPDSPQSCEWARDVYFNEGEKHLKRMKVFALISTIFVLVAFLYINWLNIRVKKAEDRKNAKIEMLTKKIDSLEKSVANYKSENKSFALLKRHSFIAKYVPGDNEVVLKGGFPADELVKMKIFDETEDNILHRENRIVDADGNLEMSIPLDIKPKSNLLVVAEFSIGEKEKRTIRKFLSIEN